MGGEATVIAPGLVGNTSVNVAPVMSTALGLVSVIVSVLVPPLRILAGVKDLVMIGCAVTSPIPSVSASSAITRNNVDWTLIMAISKSCSCSDRACPDQT